MLYIYSQFTGYIQSYRAVYLQLVYLLLVYWIPKVIQCGVLTASLQATLSHTGLNIDIQFYRLHYILTANLQATLLPNIGACSLSI